jgi:rhodanese-related sulfurtransferase
MCDIKRHAIVVCALSLLVGGCGKERGNGLSSMRGISGQNKSSALASTPDSGILFGYVRPTDPRYDITLGEVRAYVHDDTAVFVDARSPADFAFGHIRGALNIPASSKEAYLSKILESVSPDQLIVIYCNGPYCDSSDRVFEYLASQGFGNMRIFKPGWRTLSAQKDLR